MNENAEIKPIINRKKQNDNVKPILAYFSFTTKYMIKKKSTIFLPILSFIFVFIVAMMPTFFLLESDSVQTQTMLTSIFMLTTSLISISLISLFATIKALNLFKDISSEGMEILIVSKPIKRSQIILVRFSYFLFLGIMLSLVNYFAFLFGLLISMPVLPPDFPLFNHITIYFFSMIMAYVFFGSISILLSLKFSTKLVSSLSMGILGVGTILSSTIPQIMPMVEKGFEQKLFEIQNQSPNSNRFYLQYDLDDNGNLVVYVEDINTPITPEQLEFIIRAFNEKDDLSWLINLNNFLNPVAGMTKISSVKPIFYTDNNYGSSGPDFSNFNVSWKEQEIKNNYIDGFNHFVDLNIFNNKIQIDLKVVVSNNNISSPLESKEVLIGEMYSFERALDENLDSTSLKRIFDDLLKKNLNGDSQAVIDKIVAASSKVLAETFRVWIDVLNEDISWDIELKDSASVGKITSFDEEDLKIKMTTLLFYLYGLSELNNNLENFPNNNIFLDSITSGSQNNIFLGNTFGAHETKRNDDGSSTDVFTPFFYKVPSTTEYLTFVNDGEKVTSVAVGLFWFGIISVVLVGTILIYYRKDFV